MWATMGYVEEGIKYLDLEEALFLIDEVSKKITKQEYIPVGCVPTTAVTATRCQYWGG